MQVIPLTAVPSQTLTVVLSNQTCQITVYQRAQGLFCDLSVNNSPIILSVLCENLNRIVRSVYLGFIGDLCFLDNEGSNDPDYTGLGSRFSLMYLEPADLPA